MPYPVKNRSPRRAYYRGRRSPSARRSLNFYTPRWFTLLHNYLRLAASNTISFIFGAGLSYVARSLRNSPASKQRRALVTIIGVDSGCTFHTHNNVDDLVDVRPCKESFKNINGDITRCTKMGNLPLAYLDSSNKVKRLVIPNVRYVESFADTLLSVH